MFSGLTALTDLQLYNNDLNTLPGTVFSGLTALKILLLSSNDLDSLPEGLFSGLTALTRISLENNQLNALPAGVFSGLTALTRISLGGNPTDPLPLTVTVEKVGTDQVRAKVLAGAPFAVEFSVTPVNGTLDGGATELSVAAGAVDGTAVTVTRTAGTTAAVTVDVDLTTQPTLPLNHTGYEFAKSTSNLPATILPDTTNAAPAFTSPETFGVAENQTAVGTVEASDDDMDDEVTGYALNGGADQALFSIGSTSGVLTFQAAPNYEDPQDANTDNAYVVVVQATSGTGDRVKTTDQTITVTVMDVAEQPDTPAKPTVTAVEGSTTSLTATWVKPGLNGGPDITGYNVNYRVSTVTAWETFTHSGAGVTSTIDGLTESTSYQVRVQALNGETPSDWSDPSDAVSTNTAADTTCTLNTGDIWCGVVTVGEHNPGGVGVFGYGFVDATTDTGALSKTGFSVPKDGGTNSYTIDAVWVATTDFGGGAGQLTFSLTSLLDAADRAKLVLHVGSDSFVFSDADEVDNTSSYKWTKSGLDWTSESSVTLRLREAVAANVLGFSETAPRRVVPENSAARINVGAPVTATPADSGDTLEYTLEGTDASSFDIVSTSGQIRTKSGVTYDYEATKNSYSVTVKVSDGTASATIDVTISVTDVDEQPDKPAKPTVTAVEGSATRLDASWTEPGLNGGPAITGYEVEYREGISSARGPLVCAQRARSPGGSPS